MGPEVVDQRHGWRPEGTEVGEQVALDHVQHLGIAIMVDLVSKCRTHLFPENAGDLLPDIALSGQLERRGVIVPGPDNSVQYLLRSEEHTSELQSLMRISYAVFCLKKKNKIQT